MNSRVHNAAKKVGVDGPKGRRGASCRPFRARAGGDPTQGSAFVFTLGYIPAAASRLKMLAVLPDKVPDIKKRIRIVT